MFAFKCLAYHNAKITRVINVSIFFDYTQFSRNWLCSVFLYVGTSLFSFIVIRLVIVSYPRCLKITILLPTTKYYNITK